MMLRLILILLLLCGSAFADVEGEAAPTVEGLSSSTVEGLEVGAPACSEGTTTTMCDTVDGETAMTSDGIGIQFTLASQVSWWGVSLRINAASPGAYSFRIGSGDLSNPANVLDEVTGISVTESAADNYSVVQFTTCLTLPAGTYKILVVETSGNLGWQRNYSNVCSGQVGVYGSGWVGGSTDTLDYAWKSIANGI